MLNVSDKLKKYLEETSEVDVEEIIVMSMDMVMDTVKVGKKVDRMMLAAVMFDNDECLPNFLKDCIKPLYNNDLDTFMSEICSFVQVNGCEDCINDSCDVRKCVEILKKWGLKHGYKDEEEEEKCTGEARTIAEEGIEYWFNQKYCILFRVNKQSGAVYGSKIDRLEIEDVEMGAIKVGTEYFDVDHERSTEKLIKLVKLQ